MNDDEVITAVREQRDKVNSYTPLEQIISRGRAVRTRRRIPGLAGALALAAAAALAVTTLAATGHQQHPTGVRLVAWTVVRLTDGDVRVKVFKLRHPAALQRKLRAEGVPASVVTNPPGPCRRYHASSALLKKVFPHSYRLVPPPPNVIVIRLSALPSGTGVQLSGSFGSNEGAVAAPTLVHASARCTGS